MTPEEAVDAIAYLLELPCQSCGNCTPYTSPKPRGAIHYLSSEPCGECLKKGQIIETIRAAGATHG